MHLASVHLAPLLGTPALAKQQEQWVRWGGYLGACCSAGLPLLLFQAVQLAAEALILLAVQAGLGTARI